MRFVMDNSKLANELISAQNETKKPERNRSGFQNISENLMRFSQRQLTQHINKRFPLLV